MLKFSYILQNKYFKEISCSRCIDHLLDNGADPNQKTRKFGETLLEAAAVRGHYPLVAVLLQHKRCNIALDDILNILPKLFQIKMELNNQDIYRKFVLNLLLNKLLTLQNTTPFKDDKIQILNETLIQLNLSNNINKTNDSENIFQLLRLGASLTYRHENHEAVVELLDYEILETHFEDCIDNGVFYYDSVVEDYKTSYSETLILAFLANDSKKKSLLTTPLFTVLIHEKWFKINWLFYVNLTLYCLFVFSIYGHVISGLSGKENPWFLGLFYACLCFHTVKEIMQLVIYLKKYFRDPSNYIEIIVLILCYSLIASPNAYFKTLVILLSTVILFLFLVEVPKFTKFTFILGSLKYFFQYACFYFIPFLSFAIGLNILFPHSYHDNNQTISNLENASEIKKSGADHSGDYISELIKHLFETLILFTGEFNERVLQPQYYPIFGRIFMTIFILCMTIVLNNLLVGLIVSDMDRIEKESRIYKRIKMANFIVTVDEFMKQLKKNWKSGFVEDLFDYINIFKQGNQKRIVLTEVTKAHFDEKNKKHLGELEKMKWTLYDENVLKKVFDEIHKDDKE